MPNLDIFAHRGVTNKAKENTLAAFKAAMETNATGIEFDLQLTSDRVAIVTHDLNMKNTIGRSIETTDISLNALRKIKLKGTTEKILTFEELLSWAIPNNVPMNIELKESFQGNEADLEVIVRRTQALDHIHFSSFHEDVLLLVKKMNPQAIVAFIPTRKFNWDRLSDMPWVDVLHANKFFYYKEKYLKKAVEENIGLRFYGIKGKESCLKNPHPAVIGWITDYPDKVYNALK